MDIPLRYVTGHSGQHSLLSSAEWEMSTSQGVAVVTCSSALRLKGNCRFVVHCSCVTYSVVYPSRSLTAWGGDEHPAYTSVRSMAPFNSSFTSVVVQRRCHHTTITTVLRPFFRDHLGEPAPKQNFLTSWYKGRLTEADTDHPTGRHSIQTSQCPPPPSPHFLQARCPFCHPTNSVKALKAVQRRCHRPEN